MGASSIEADAGNAKGITLDKFHKVMQLTMPLLASAVNVGLKILMGLLLVTVAVVAAILTGALRGGRGR